MSTAATRRGYDRHALEIQMRQHIRGKSVWHREEMKAGYCDENRAVWVRFYQLNQMIWYYQINCLNRKIYATYHPHQRTEMKRVYRYLIQRMGRCEKPRLP